MRWKGYAVPPESNANYAWILHMLNKLEVTKGVAGFLLANGALDDSDTLEIRKKLRKMIKLKRFLYCLEKCFILPILVSHCGF